MVAEMPYLDFLAGLHRALEPRTYLEIGIRTGSSLQPSRARSLGIDPDFKVSTPLSCPVTLARTTSDEYFAKSDPLAPLGGKPADLAFIDGMHLFEFALRDFINVETSSRFSSAVVFDDMLPRRPEHAARDRHTRTWTGDVFKIIPVLRRYRPDLRLLLADTAPTGLLVVVGLDPSSTVLRERYEAIVAEYVVPDPQDVPESTLNREGAVDAAELLRSPVWGALRRGRRPWETRERVRAEIDAALTNPSGYRLKRRDARRQALRAVRKAARRSPVPIPALRSVGL